MLGKLSSPSSPPDCCPYPQRPRWSNRCAGSLLSDRPVHMVEACGYLPPPTWCSPLRCHSAGHFSTVHQQGGKDNGLALTPWPAASCTVASTTHSPYFADLERSGRLAASGARRARVNPERTTFDTFRPCYAARGHNGDCRRALFARCWLLVDGRIGALPFPGAPEPVWEGSTC